MATRDVRMSFSPELYIGTRYVRSHGRNRFLSFISVISMLGIAVGVAVLIVVLSVVNGFETELRERLLSMTSHATISGYTDELSNWQDLRGIALRHDEVVGAAPYVEAEAMLLANGAMSGALLSGIDPELEQTVSGVHEKMTTGELGSLGPGAYNIVLGKALAEALDVGDGDKVYVAVAHSRVTPVGIFPTVKKFTISGLFEVGMHEYDRNVGFIHQSDAQKLYRMGSRVTGVRLKLVDLFRAPVVVREVAQDIGGVYVSDWTRRHVNFFRSIQTTKSILFVILLLVVGVAAFNIVSTLVMVVKEKEGDIAILRTLGSTPASITGIFMVQGTIIGFVGTMAGVALGLLIAVNTEVLVQGLEAVLNTKLLAPDVYFISDLPSEVRARDLLVISTTAFAVSFLSTLYPARRAARTQPAEVLRYE